MTAIKPLPPITAPADIMAQARENVASRLRSRGYEATGDAVARGEQDGCWAMRHEVNRLTADRQRAPLAHVPV